MARWKLETGKIINGNYNLNLKNYCCHKPDQVKDKETDFTILMEDGSTIKATLIKEPKDLIEYVKLNLTDIDIQDHNDNHYGYYLNYVLYAYIPKSWHLERQIDTLHKLIEIYKK